MSEAPTQKVELVVTSGGDEPSAAPRSPPAWGSYVMSGAFIVVIIILMYFLVPHLSRANAMAVQLEDLRGEVRDLRNAMMKMAMRSTKR